MYTRTVAAARAAAPQTRTTNAKDLSFRDNAHFNQGDVNVDQVQNLHIHSNLDRNLLVNTFLLDLHLVHPESTRDRVERLDDEDWQAGFQWVLREPAVDKWFSHKSGALSIVDETGRGHPLAVLAIVEEAHRRSTSDCPGGIASFFCKPGDGAAEVLGGLLHMLLLHRRELLERLYVDQLQYFTHIPRSGLPFSTLFNIMSGLLGHDLSGPVHFFLASLDACSVKGKRDVLDFMKETERYSCPTKWAVSSDNKMSASIWANTLIITLDQVCEGLQLDEAYRIIRDTANSASPSPEPHLQESLTSQSLRDSVSEHWLQYTKIGRSWLVQPSPAVLIFRHSDAETPSHRFEIPELLRKWSAGPFVSSYFLVPRNSPNETPNETPTGGEIIWALYIQIVAGNFETELSLKAFLVRLRPFLQSHLRNICSEPPCKESHTGGLHCNAFRCSVTGLRCDWVPLVSELVDDFFQSVTSGIVSVLENINSLPIEEADGLIKFLANHASNRWKVFASFSYQDSEDPEKLAFPTTELMGIATVSDITEYTECLQSLYFDDIDTRERDIEDALPDTNKWLWINTTFKDWLNHAGVLWISGLPGSGKSVLAKTILKSFTTAVSQDRTNLPQAVCGWFYSARLLRAGKSHSFMLMAIIYQILLQNKGLFELAKVMYHQRFDDCQSKGQSKVSWDREYLEPLACDIATSDKTPPTLAIIDAMDESEDGEENKKNRAKMLELLSSLVLVPNSRVWLIALSRPLPQIRSEFEKCHHIEIDKCNQEDVDRVIKSKIQEVRQALSGVPPPKGGKARHQQGDTKRNTTRVKRLEPDDEKQLEAMQQHLDTHNSGVIMWVILVFAQMKIVLDRNEGFNLIQLRQVVESLPGELEKLYVSIVSELGWQKDAEKLKMGKRILLWVTGSAAWGSLQLQNLLDGLAVPEDLAQADFDPILSQRLRIGNDWNKFFSIIHSHCGPLVEIKNPLDSVTVDQSIHYVDMVRGDWNVNLIHQTAKKFLENSVLHIKDDMAKDFVRSECQRYLDIVFPVRRTSYTPFLSRSIIEEAKYGGLEDFGSFENPEETPPHEVAIEALENLMNLPTAVKSELERLGHYLNSKLLLPYAFDVLRKCQMRDSWAEARQPMTSPVSQDNDAFFLSWIIDEDPYWDITALVAYLIAYLCRSGYSTGLSNLLLVLDVMRDDTQHLFSYSLALGMAYGAMYTFVKLAVSHPEGPFLNTRAVEWFNQLTQLVPEAGVSPVLATSGYGKWRCSRYAPVLAVWGSLAELEKAQQATVGATGLDPDDELTVEWTSGTGVIEEANLVNIQRCIDSILARWEVGRLFNITQLAKLAVSVIGTCKVLIEFPGRAARVLKAVFVEISSLHSVLENFNFLTSASQDPAGKDIRNILVLCRATLEVVSVELDNLVDSLAGPESGGDEETRMTVELESTSRLQGRLEDLRFYKTQFTIFGTVNQ